MYLKRCASDVIHAVCVGLSRGLTVMTEASKELHFLTEIICEHCSFTLGGDTLEVLTFLVPQPQPLCSIASCNQRWMPKIPVRGLHSSYVISLIRIQEILNLIWIGPIQNQPAVQPSSELNTSILPTSYAHGYLRFRMPAVANLPDSEGTVNSSGTVHTLART